MPILRWRHYGDHLVAPLGDHGLAPMGRSVTVCTDHSVEPLQRLAVELADEIASGKKRVCPLPGLVGKAIFASGSSETDCCGIGIPLKIQILSFRPIGGAARRAAR